MLAILADEVSDLNGRLLSLEAALNAGRQADADIADDIFAQANGQAAAQGGRRAGCEKAESPVWKGFESYGGKTKYSGDGRDRRYYEWDGMHNEIEVYDAKGNHLGVMDPVTGQLISGPVEGRNIKDTVK